MENKPFLIHTLLLKICKVSFEHSKSTRGVKFRLVRCIITDSSDMPKLACSFNSDNYYTLRLFVAYFLFIIREPSQCPSYTFLTLSLTTPDLKSCTINKQQHLLIPCADGKFSRYIMNRICSNTEPCGSPLDTEGVFDSITFYLYIVLCLTSARRTVEVFSTLINFLEFQFH